MFTTGVHYQERLYSDTVAGVYIITINTPIGFNFELYQAFKQHEYTEKNRKKLDNNKHLNKKVVFILLILSPTTLLNTKSSKIN